MFPDHHDPPYITGWADDIPEIHLSILDKWKKKSTSLQSIRDWALHKADRDRDEHLLENAFRINTYVGKETEAGWAKREVPNPAGNSQAGTALQSCPALGPESQVLIPMHRPIIVFGLPGERNRWLFLEDTIPKDG